MTYARISPECLMDMQPYMDRLHAAKCMLLVAKEHREHAENVELIALDHMAAAHHALSAEVVRIFPELAGTEFLLNADTGEITLHGASV